MVMIGAACQAEPYRPDVRHPISYVTGRFINLIVNGGSSADSAVCFGEDVNDSTIASAWVETYAILTEVSGLLNGEHLAIPSDFFR